LNGYGFLHTWTGTVFFTPVWCFTHIYGFLRTQFSHMFPKNHKNNDWWNYLKKMNKWFKLPNMICALGIFTRPGGKPPSIWMANLGTDCPANTLQPGTGQLPPNPSTARDPEAHRLGVGTSRLAWAGRAHESSVGA
jgi:hypothetical protein